MREVTIEELKEGDEVLISCQSYFKYLRLLQTPKLGTKKHWKTGVPLYKSVKCSTRRDSITKTWTNYNGTGTTYIEYKWVFGPDDHNFTQYINLTGRQILLVKEK